jgi:hypothetical protein
MKFQFSQQVISLVKPAICPEPGELEICTVVEKCLATACSDINRPLSGVPGKFEMHVEVMFPLTFDISRYASPHKKGRTVKCVM